MSAGPTLCDACDHVEPTSRKMAPRRWLCMQHPKLPGYDGFVAGQVWEKDEPFLLCSKVNGGLCKTFTPARTPQIEMPMEKDNG